MSESITSLLIEFQQRVSQISDFELINKSLIEIFQNDLKYIRSNSAGANGVDGAINRVLVKYEKNILENIPDLKPKITFLQNWSIVSIVGALEVFIGDLLRIVAIESPDTIKWPEKDKKIVIDPSDFNSHLTMGDIFVKHLRTTKQKSFQDLQSILSVFKEYLNIEIKLKDKIINDIIFATSSRHLIAHKNSKVDVTFLRQVKAITDLQEYNMGEELKISPEMIERIQESILSFANTLVQSILERE